MIGFTNASNSGSEGIEAAYNSYLEGTVGKVITTKGNNEMDMPFSYENYIASRQGDSVVLTLDVTVQAQVLGLLKKLSRELGIAVLLITHDLSVVAAICRWVAVMYRGQVVEWGTAEQIFRAPKHPYTQKLLQEERP